MDEEDERELSMALTQGGRSDAGRGRDGGAGIWNRSIIGARKRGTPCGRRRLSGGIRLGRGALDAAAVPGT